MTDEGPMLVTREHAIKAAQNAMRNQGYAVAVHGSQVKDLDLVAIPWRDTALTAQQVAEIIASAIPGFIEKGSPEAMPHGRLSFTIRPNSHWGFDHWYIDLAVMPRECDWATTADTEDAEHPTPEPETWDCGCPFGGPHDDRCKVGAPSVPGKEGDGAGASSAQDTLRESLALLVDAIVLGGYRGALLDREVNRAREALRAASPAPTPCDHVWEPITLTCLVCGAPAPEETT